MPPRPANPWYDSPNIRWGLGGTVLALIGILLVLIAADKLPGLPADRFDQAAISYSKAAPDSKFTVSLQAPLNRHPLTPSISATLIMANAGDQAIRLEHFEADHACPFLQLEDGQPIPTIFPHGTVEFTVHLVPVCDAQTQQISLHYQAHIGDQPSGPPEFDGFISSGPIVVVSQWRQFGNRLLSLLSSLSRLIAIPILLAAFGWWLNDQVGKRDQRLKREQEQRDRRNEVLNTLISRYSELVETHYLAISRRMGTVEAELPPSLRLPTAAPLAMPLLPDEVTSLLCAILLLRARLLHLLSTKGGFYFRSKQAENLVVDLLSGFLAEVWRRLNKARFEALVELLNPDDTLSVAVRKCTTGTVARPQGQTPLTQAEIEENKASFETMRQAFTGWITAEPAEFRAYTRLLQIASNVLAFECDRPFYQTAPVPSEAAPGAPVDADPQLRSGWYFDPPTLTLKKEMFDLPGPLRDDFLEKVKLYLKSLPNECKGDVDRLP